MCIRDSCVGSRDEKVCQQHCSKVCCITGVKQAMEMRQMFPEADVFNFYMDIRCLLYTSTNR